MKLSSPAFPLEEYTLPNGLHVVLHCDQSVPVAAVEVMYHVGSKNERPGQTGLAHLFEHMMFKGSLNVPDGEHFRRLQAIGGYVNGSTSEDRTNYYELVPAEYLELALFLEADRMGFLLPALTQHKLDNQRDVVRNERRQSYENQPYGLAHETILASLYPPRHPYHWPVIGSMEDLARASLEDVSQFFRTFHAPNNACLVVAGKFDLDSTRESIARLFGPIPGGSHVERPVLSPASLDEPRAVTLPDTVQLPRLYCAWHSAPWNTREDAALDVFTDILSAGKNSRLHRSLVVEQRRAQSVIAYQHGLEASGRTVLQITPQPGHTLEELHAAAHFVIEELLIAGPTEREIQKSINMKSSQHIHGLTGMLQRASGLATHHTLGGSARQLLNFLDRFDGITPQEVRECAVRVIRKPDVRLSVVPRTGVPA